MLLAMNRHMSVPLPDFVANIEYSLGIIAPSMALPASFTLMIIWLSSALVETAIVPSFVNLTGLSGLS